MSTQSGPPVFNLSAATSPRPVGQRPIPIDRPDEVLDESWLDSTVPADDSRWDDRVDMPGLRNGLTARQILTAVRDHCQQGVSLSTRALYASLPGDEKERIHLFTAGQPPVFLKPIYPAQVIWLTEKAMGHLGQSQTTTIDVETPTTTSTFSTAGSPAQTRQQPIGMMPPPQTYSPGLKSFQTPVNIGGYNGGNTSTGSAPASGEARQQQVNLAMLTSLAAISHATTQRALTLDKLTLRAVEDAKALSDWCLKTAIALANTPLELQAGIVYRTALSQDIQMAVCSEARRTDKSLAPGAIPANLTFEGLCKLIRQR